MKKPLLIAIAILAVTSSISWAQVGAGEIFGKVSDTSGAVVPGVTVTLESPALLTPQSVASTESGAYRFPEIPIGTYTIRFEIPGFKRLVREGVRIDTGFHAEINVKLEISSVEETVTVSGATPVVDTRTTTIRSNFTKDVLESVPSTRDPWTILEQSPGMVMNKQNVGGSGSGQQSSFFNKGSSGNQAWNIEGATVTDMSANTAPMYFDFDAFEEIQIQTGGADASTDVGGVTINIVLKGGSNDFKGGIRGFLTDNSLQSNNVTDELRAQNAGAGNPLKRINDYGFDLGGPIVRNRAWFWGAFSKQMVKVGVVNFLKPGATDPLDPENLMDDITNMPHHNGKVQWQWTKNQRSSFLYTRSEKTRNARGAGPLNPLETTYRQGKPTIIYKGDYQWIVSDRFVVEGKFTYMDGGYILDYQSPENAKIQPTYDIVTRMNGRSGNFRDYITPTTEAKVDANYLLSGFLGADHALKAGVRYRGSPNQTIYSSGGNATARFRNGVPSEASIIRDGDVSLFQATYSAYVNDSIKRGRLTLNLGLRADISRDEAKAANIKANSILPDLLPAVDFKGAKSGAAYNDFSPRLGVTYDLLGTGKTIAKANYARYYGVGIYTASTLSPTGPTTLTFPWTDLDGDRFVSRNEVDLTRMLSFSSNYDPANPSSVRSPATVDPGIKNDRTDEFIVGVEHELMRDFGVGISYVRRSYDRFSWSPKVGLKSSDFYAVPLTAKCGNTTCPEASYTVEYYQLPFTVPAASVLTNQKYTRSFQGIEITARRRFVNNWMMNGSFAYNDTSAHYDGGPDLAYQDPTNIRQLDGYQTQSLNAKWVAKLAGTVALPYGIGAGAVLNARQGYPRNLTVLSPSRSGALGTVDVYVAPYGSNRYPTMVLFDARVDKTFLVNRLKFAVSLDLFNIMNANTVLTAETRQNTSTANNVQTILAPRVARVGVKFSF